MGLDYYERNFSSIWVSKFDWHYQNMKVAEINKFPNFITKIDDIDIHFIHED